MFFSRWFRQLSQPNIFNNNIIIIIIIYIIILYILKKQKNYKGHFKIFLIFSRIFLSIFHSIGLYLYTVRYRSSIKILGFLWNIFLFFLNSKKNLKTFKLISPFKKFFQTYFYIKKYKKICIFLMFFFLSKKKRS